MKNFSYFALKVFGLIQFSSYKHFISTFIKMAFWREHNIIIISSMLWLRVWWEKCARMPCLRFRLTMQRAISWHKSFQASPKLSLKTQRWTRNFWLLIRVMPITVHILNQSWNSPRKMPNWVKKLDYSFLFPTPQTEILIVFHWMKMHQTYRCRKWMESYHRALWGVVGWCCCSCHST